MLLRFLKLTIESKKDMQKYLGYELSSYPLSLFDTGGMRKTQKSALYEQFKIETDVTFNPSDNVVIDGGFLLHKVRWNVKKNTCKYY